MKQPRDSKILLHVCCGICGLEVIQRLKQDFNEVVLFFYNPNVQPNKEYQRRLAVVRQIAQSQKLKLIEGVCETARWLKAVKGLENEPEGGLRCPLCFEFRLAKTAETAEKSDCTWFATTLTVSPHKPAAIINAIGTKLAENYGLGFLAEDFKKKDGFKKTMAAAKKHNFYRQNYCGCLFSLN